VNHDLHELFLERTRQEVSRSERYCLFLSLVLVDLNDFIRAVANREHGDQVDPLTVTSGIARGLKQSLRNSDVVSSLEKNRMGVLLMETSMSGLETVQNRIESFIRDYLKGELRLPFEPPIEIQTASYPEESERFTDLTSLLEHNHQPVK
jgi:GGDEF domain-containing protein